MHSVLWMWYCAWLWTVCRLVELQTSSSIRSLSSSSLSSTKVRRVFVTDCYRLKLGVSQTKTQDTDVTTVQWIGISQQSAVICAAALSLVHDASIHCSWRAVTAQLILTDEINQIKKNKKEQKCQKHHPFCFYLTLRIHSAHYMMSVCLCVCLSVSFRCCVRTAKHLVMSLQE